MTHAERMLATREAEVLALRAEVARLTRELNTPPIANDSRGARQ